MAEDKSKDVGLQAKSIEAKIPTFLEKAKAMERAIDGKGSSAPFKDCTKVEQDERLDYFKELTDQGQEIFRASEKVGMERMEQGAFNEFLVKYEESMDYYNKAKGMANEAKEEEGGEEREEDKEMESGMNKENARMATKIKANSVLRKLQMESSSRTILSEKERKAARGPMPTNNGDVSDKDFLEILTATPIATKARGRTLNDAESFFIDERDEMPFFFSKGERDAYVERRMPGWLERNLGGEKKRSITGTGATGLDGDTTLHKTSLDLIAKPGLAQMTDLVKVAGGDHSWNTATGSGDISIYDEGSPVASRTYTNDSLTLDPHRISVRIDITKQSMFQEAQIQSLAVEQITNYLALAVSERVISLNEAGDNKGAGHVSGVADIASRGLTLTQLNSYGQDQAGSSISNAQLGLLLSQLKQVPESYGKRMVATSPLGAYSIMRKVADQYNAQFLVGNLQDPKVPTSFSTGADKPKPTFVLGNQFPVYTFDHMDLSGSVFYPSATLQHSNTEILAGDFSVIKTVIWGGVNVVVDNTTDAPSDTVRLIAHLYMSVGITRPSLILYADTFGINITV